jgi:hypothetical protein
MTACSRHWLLVSLQQSCTTAGLRAAQSDALKRRCNARAAHGMEYGQGRAA